MNGKRKIVRLSVLLSSFVIYNTLEENCLRELSGFLLLFDEYDYIKTFNGRISS